MRSFLYNVMDNYLRRGYGDHQNNDDGRYNHCYRAGRRVLFAALFIKQDVEFLYARI